MTAICGGNTSQAKPGFAQTVVVSTAALAAAAVNWPAAWAVAYASLLSYVSFNLSNICVVDPPADPGFTAADALAMLNPWLLDPVPYQLATDKLTQLLTRYLWYTFCQCNGVATPAPPASPAAPVGLPDPNPPVPGPTPSVCQNTGLTSGFGYPAAGLNSQANVTAPNPTSVQVSMLWTTAGAGPHPQPVFGTSWFIPGVGLAQDVRNVSPVNGVLTKVTIPVPFGSYKFNFGVSSNNNPSTDSVTMNCDFYCNGQLPNVPAAPCCPPDPSLEGQIQVILGYVKLIQRQMAPFAYVTGASHTGLTGQGTVAVQGLLGVKTTLTTIPPSLGQELDQPTFYFDAGWISYQTPDGVIDERRVTRAAQVWTPPGMSDATIIGYSLAPGVVATITELQREP